MHCGPRANPSGCTGAGSSQKGGIMCKHTITVLAASVVLALASFLPGPAQAQNDSARPAAQDLASEPIGKVVAATGSVTIEHASAVVVQANVPGQVGQTKVGDLVYLGDVVQTGVDGRVGINFTDGTSFNLSSNANMALDKYVYDPGRVETPFIPPKTTADGRGPRRRDRLSIFCGIESGVNPAQP
jgi:hypothetical protein